jgi:hypothetical protein
MKVLTNYTFHQLSIKIIYKNIIIIIYYCLSFLSMNFFFKILFKSHISFNLNVFLYISNFLNLLNVFILYWLKEYEFLWITLNYKCEYMIKQDERFITDLNFYFNNLNKFTFIFVIYNFFIFNILIL